MKKVIGIGVLLILVILLFTWEPASAQIADPAPEVIITHKACAPCEVWLSEAPNGVSGLIAMVTEDVEREPLSNVFMFEGSLPGDLISTSRRIEWTYARADLLDRIGPTTDPVFLFRFWGPATELKALRVDDDQGGIVVEIP